MWDKDKKDIYFFKSDKSFYAPETDGGLLG